MRFSASSAASCRKFGCAAKNLTVCNADEALIKILLLRSVEMWNDIRDKRPADDESNDDRSQKSDGSLPAINGPAATWA